MTTSLNLASEHAAPAAWNSLPPTLQQISHTDSFKRQLKTFLFYQAYLDY